MSDLWKLKKAREMFLELKLSTCTVKKIHTHLKKTVEQFKPFAFSDRLRTETRQD